MDNQGGHYFPFDLSPIAKIDVFREVKKQLETALMQMQPGEKLGSERELAARLNISRVSVREALRALEGQGKVEIRRNRGIFVADPQRIQVRTHFDIASLDSIELVRHIAQVRAALEPKVVDLVLQNPQADLSHIAVVLEVMKSDLEDDSNEEPNDYSSLDLRFEDALGKEAGNPILAAYQRSIHELWIEVWVSLGGVVGDRRAFYRDHEMIYNAIVQGNRDEALRLMAIHVDPDSAAL